MNRGDFANLLVDNLREYYSKGVIKSITRNSHMNNYIHDENTERNNELIKAVLVDFVNFVCMKQCLDLGLYTKDIED